MDQNVPLAVAYRGICRYKQGDVAAAIRDLEKSAGRPSPLAQLYYAKALFRSGDDSRAAKVLLRCEEEIAKDCGHEMSRPKLLYRLGIPHNNTSHIAKSWTRLGAREDLERALRIVSYPCLASQQ